MCQERFAADVLGTYLQKLLASEGLKPRKCQARSRTPFTRRHLPRALRPRSIAALHGDEVDLRGLVALVADVVRSEPRQPVGLACLKDFASGRA